MSNESEAFSALDHIIDGDWDRFLVRLKAAIRMRQLTTEYTNHIIVGDED